MFCGLPVIVAALPMLLAVARPSSSGMGSTSAISAASIIRGVSARHTTSLMKNAARRPDAATVIASIPKPDRARPSKACATIRERAGQAQIRHHDHHPEQQGDSVKVDGANGGGFAKRARHNHRDCARQRSAGAIDPQPRNFAQGDHRVGQGENDEGQEVAGKHRGIFRLPGVGSVGTRGIVQAYRYGNSTQGG